MGFFSFLRTKDPDKVAAELVAAALSLEVSPLEQDWIKRLGVELHRYVTERNSLRVGMTQAGVGLAIGDTRHISSPRHKLDVAMERQFADFFAAMPNVTPDEGRAYYRHLSDRYILRTPEEMTGIFHYYLTNPGEWQDRDPESTPAYALPEGFQSFVHQIMREPLRTARDRALELEA